MGPHLWHVMVLCFKSTNTILTMCQMGVKGRCWNERTSAFNYSIWKERRNKPGEKGAGKPLWCLLSAPRGHWLTGPFDRTAHNNFRMSVFSQKWCPGRVSSHRVLGVYTVCSMRNKNPLWASTNCSELSQQAGTSERSSQACHHFSNFTYYMRDPHLLRNIKLSLSSS